MEHWGIYLLGFLGQGFFGARLLIQWVQSERQGRVTSPVVFWYLSVMGAFTFLIYGLIRKDIVIIGGQFLSYYIYVRNIQLKGRWTQLPILLKWIIVLLPVATVVSFADSLHAETTLNYSYLFHPILIIGAIGQLALNLRFVYQWYYSEQHAESSLPYSFWAISTWASILVIVYACFHPIDDIEPVLLVSQTLGIVPYIRNMIIARRTKLHKERNP